MKRAVAIFVIIIITIAISLGIFILIDCNIKELESGSIVRDIEKNYGIIYMITEDDSLYVNGEHHHGIDFAALGFNNNFFYKIRSFIGKYNPIFVTNNIQSISMGCYGSAYIKTDGSLWCFTNAVNGYKRPKMIASDVIDVAFNDFDVFYLSSNGTLFYRDIKHCETERAIASNVAGIKNFGAGETAVLKDDGTLYVYTASNGIRCEKIAENIIDYSGATGNPNVISFIDDNYNAYMYDVNSNHKQYITNNAMSISMGWINLIQKKDGSVEAFINNSAITYKLRVSNAVKVSADISSSSVLTSDNKVISWGDGVFGQFGYANSESSDLKSYSPQKYEIFQDGYVFTP